MENPNEIRNLVSTQTDECIKVKPQNQHYNIKKQALGPNSKRGK